MKKLMIFAVLVACLMSIPASNQAYTIDDSVSDAIGQRGFESYGIDVYNYTPGVNSGGIVIELFTNFPQSGLVVGGWNTPAADLFIQETYQGNDYLWAVPLVAHDGFTPSTMYAVGTSNVSDFYEPAGGGYTYNHGVPVRIATQGVNNGLGSVGAFSVSWNALAAPGSPDWMIRISSDLYQDDPNGVFSFTWGTATCANDVVTGTVPGQVPEPTTMLLLGFGLVGLAGVKKKFNK